MRLHITTGHGRRRQPALGTRSAHTRPDPTPFESNPEPAFTTRVHGGAQGKPSRRELAILTFDICAAQVVFYEHLAIPEWALSGTATNPSLTAEELVCDAIENHCCDRDHSFFSGVIPTFQEALK